MDISIREFKTGDTDSIIRLMNEFEDYYAGLEQPVRSSRSPEFGKAFVPALLKSLEEKDGRMFVALDDGKIVGFTAGIIEDQEETERIAEGENKNGFILELFVREEVRKLGIGSRLIEEIEKYLKEKDCTRIFLEVESANEKVIKFYENSGYEMKRKILVKILS